MTQYNFVGVDIAKDKFDVALQSNNTYTHQLFTNDLKGFQFFLSWLKQHTIHPWICMEATGHYGEALAEYLTVQNINVSIINPYQIKQFARSKLARNKNDVIDAKLIEQFAQSNCLRVFQVRSLSQKDIKDLVKILDILKSQAVQLKNQLHSAQGETAKEVLRKLIKEIEIKIADIEKTIGERVQSEENMHQQLRLLTSIKGIGKLTAYKILAQTPNIEIYQKAKQFAAALGVTPRQNQSGKFQGKTRISRLGDARLRKALYMAALVARRYNPVLKHFADRLKLHGKAAKAIICAVMRKLAHIIFGVLKHQKPFNSALM
jgi:transposase